MAERKRLWWLLAVAVLLTGSLLWFTFRNGVTESNGHRIAVGMTEMQVESLLGAPNPLASKNQSFWDAYDCCGWKYIGITVYYDADRRVTSKKVKSFWSKPNWWP